LTFAVKAIYRRFVAGVKAIASAPVAGAFRIFGDRGPGR
jgi:hypothetical protein